MTEQTVGIVSRLYQCRKAVLFLLGPEKFQAKVAEWAPIIKGVMKAQNCDEIRATMAIVEKLQSGGHDGLMVFAVCVEMLEPSGVVQG